MWMRGPDSTGGSYSLPAQVLVEGPVLGHLLVGVEPQLGQGKPARPAGGELEQRAPDALTLPLGVHRDVADEQMIGLRLNHDHAGRRAVHRQIGVAGGDIGRVVVVHRAGSLTDAVHVVPVGTVDDRGHRAGVRRSGGPDLHQSPRPRSVAQRVSSCREDSWSFRSTEDTWASTVFGEMSRRRAISLYM